MSRHAGADLGLGDQMSGIGRIFAACGLVLALCLALGACTPKADPREESQSRAIYDAIASGDVAKTQALASPVLRPHITPEAVKQFQQSIPSSKPDRITTVDVLTANTRNGSLTGLETEYDFPGPTYVVLRTSFLTAPRAPNGELVSVDLRTETPAQIAQERVLRDRISKNRRIVQGLWYASLAIILLAAAELLYSRPKGWGWWLASALLGFCGFGVNLATGAFTFTLLNISLLGMNLIAHEPWAFYVSIPVFALISLSQSGQSIAYRRRVNRLKAQAAKASYVGEPPKTEPPGS